MEETIKYVPLVATPLKDGEAAPILDEASYLTLDRMLNSRDEGDHKIAQLTLNTCDIRKSIYWIWKLSKNHLNNMVNLRTKASRAFRDHSCLFDIWSKSHLEFAEFCLKKDWLTSEIYVRLEHKIVFTIGSQFRNTFYDVNFQIKDQYKHFPLDKTVITVKHG